MIDCKFLQLSLTYVYVNSNVKYCWCRCVARPRWCRRVREWICGQDDSSAGRPRQFTDHFHQEWCRLGLIQVSYVSTEGQLLS